MKRQRLKKKWKKKVPYWSQLGTCHSPYAGIVEESLYRKHCTSVGSVFPVGKKKQHIKKKKKRRPVRNSRSCSVQVPNYFYSKNWDRKPQSKFLRNNVHEPRKDFKRENNIKTINILSGQKKKRMKPWHNYHLLLRYNKEHGLHSR